MNNTKVPYPALMNYGLEFRPLGHGGYDEIP
jgi:hypothetical protein